MQQLSIKRNKWGKPYLDGEGSLWFKRLSKEIKKLDNNIRFKRAKYGFYRLYWRQAYLHELCKDMPLNGYNFEMNDPRFESQKYFEELEDRDQFTMNIKNFREGYLDSRDTIMRRAYMMRNNAEFNTNATKAYRQMRVF